MILYKRVEGILLHEIATVNPEEATINEGYICLLTHWRQSIYTFLSTLSHQKSNTLLLVGYFFIPLAFQQKIFSILSDNKYFFIQISQKY